MPLYKTFVRPNPDYANIIFDDTYYKTFHQKFESIQYNTCVPLFKIVKRKTLPRIRLVILQIATLVQETLLIL